jgi:hypothetical protein
MARDWQAFAEPKAGEWNIPSPTLTELGVRIQAADAVLAEARNETTRTPRGHGLAQGNVRGRARRNPARPEDLRKAFFTMRKKDVVKFDFGDSGKTACFAAQIENNGKQDPWGPLVSALIP